MVAALPCYYNNMQWMNNRGATVWFHLPPEIIAGRIKKKTKRPLIAHLPDEEIPVHQREITGAIVFLWEGTISLRPV